MSGDRNEHSETGALWGPARLSWEDLRFLMSELESIARAGFPMLPALQSLSRDMKLSRLKKVLEHIEADLERGESLETALERQGERFPPLLLALLRAGERTGNVAGVLGLMSTHAGKMCRVSAALRTALVYPAVLLAASALLFGYQMLLVVPSFRDTFEALNVPLPAITRALFAISRQMQDHGPQIALGTCGGLVLAFLIWRVFVPPALRRRAGGQALLWIPWYGGIYHAILETRFARSLRLLLLSRTPAVEAIVLSGAAAGNAVAERAAEYASGRVANGERLSDALRDSGFFSHKLCWMVGAGEERGGVEDTLAHIADSLEREVEASEQVFGMLAGPLLTLIIAAGAAFFVAGVYMPLYGAGRALGVE